MNNAQNPNRYENLIANAQLKRIKVGEIAAFIIVLSVFAILAFGANELVAPYPIGKLPNIVLVPSALPSYAAQTTLRMLIALLLSLGVTFVVAPLAAKNKQIEKVLLPLIDILECVPVLGVLSISVVAFIALFPNSRLGPESAAIFAIFTSQVWNMILSFYQSLITVPKDFHDTARVFHLSSWQRFWRIEVPYALPGLIWNTMISMSSAWFFVVACEAISVSNQTILLPGVGSYISVAIRAADLNAIFYAILTMLIVIFIYDQLLFRPLLHWSERFKPEQTHEINATYSWFYVLLAKTRWFKMRSGFSARLRSLENLKNLRNLSFLTKPFSWPFSANDGVKTFLKFVWNGVVLLIIVLSTLTLFNFIRETVTLTEVLHAFYLGAITALKIFILILVTSLIWVPIGVWIGLKPAAQRFFQPLTQFLAAFPANLIYPLLVTLIVQYDLNPNIWTTPLMILGAQWYLLFNVIAGAANIPNDLKLTVRNFGLSLRLQWKRLFFPAIFPYYITGAMSAAAGCWNASIVADVLSWGEHKVVATGLGQYIAEHTTTGDFPRLALGIFVMCCYVILFNRLIWQKLYHLARERYSFSEGG